MKKTKMNTKNLLVTLSTIAFALLLVANVSACGNTTYGFSDVEVNNVNIADAVAVAGEDILLSVEFWAEAEDGEVTIEVELDADKDVEVSTEVFSVLEGEYVRKILRLTVPAELKDDLYEDYELTISVDGNVLNFEESFYLTVRRQTYNADVKSITVPSSVAAGDTIPVEIVLKNMGFNDLDDVFVTAKFVGFNAEQAKYFGDIVTFENDEDYCEFTYDENGSVTVINCHDDDDSDEDTLVGKLYLKVPYDVSAGTYDLEIIVENDDTTTTEVKKVMISNDFTENVIVTSTIKSVAIGEEAHYDLLIVNPTDNVKVYRIVTEGNVLSTTQSVVAVPAGSSKTVKVTGLAEEAGEYSFAVNIFDGETLAKTVVLQMNVDGKESTDTVVVLTIVLAVLFLVLLVVLIVLLSRKPDRSEDLGESYY